MNLNNNGFTLVELLIVIVIVTIIAAIAVPNFTNFRQTADIEVSAQNIASIQRAMRYHVRLNQLSEGDPLVSTDFIENASDKMINLPTSPFSDGGYSYGNVVPAQGVCYASETSPTKSMEVNDFVNDNRYCN